MKQKKGIDTVGSRLEASSKAMGQALSTATTDFIDNAVRTSESLQSNLQGHIEQSEVLMNNVVSETEKGINEAGTRLVENSISIGKSIDSAATEVYP